MHQCLCMQSCKLSARKTKPCLEMESSELATWLKIAFLNWNVRKRHRMVGPSAARPKLATGVHVSWSIAYSYRLPKQRTKHPWQSGRKAHRLTDRDSYILLGKRRIPLTHFLYCMFNQTRGSPFAVRDDEKEIWASKLHTPTSSFRHHYHHS
jgi:hypothetical protein